MSVIPGNNNLPPCKFSGKHDLQLILDLGVTPVADRLLTFDKLAEPEVFVPLRLAISSGSGLVQITDTVSEQDLYCNDYPYFSSVSHRLLKHFKKSADNLITTRKLNKNSLVIEAASNDGYMLQFFTERNIPVLGIEPARLQAEYARAKKIPTINTFFNRELALELHEKNVRADVFIANNILAHVLQLTGFIDSMSLLLKEDGVAVIEVPYVVDMIDNCEFDTIYHQHIYYFSLTSLKYIFGNSGMYINNLEKTDIHGGSIRIYVEKHEAEQQDVTKQLEYEQSRNIGSIDFYKDFPDRIITIKTRLQQLLSSIKKEGGRIAAYGAAAKATTFLSFMQIDEKYIDYVVDLNEFKHGKYMGGNHLEIYPVTKLLEDVPDYTLILAWNFSDEIIRQMEPYLKLGGKFIIPIPELKIIREYQN